MNRHLLATVSVGALSIALGGILSVTPISRAFAQQPSGQSTEDLATLEKDIAKLRAENAALRERDRLLRQNMTLRERERTDRQALGARGQGRPQPTGPVPPHGAAVALGSPLAVDPETGIPTALLDYTGGPSDQVFKAPIGRPGRFNVWAEGGAVWSGGDPMFGTNATALFSGLPVSFSLTPKVGWAVDSGFDYRFADSLWHVGADVQYGQSRVSKSTTSSFGLSTMGGASIAISQAATGTDNETHWLADFTVGRDLGVGRDAMEIKGGIRIAQLTADTGVASALTETLHGLTTVKTTGGGTPSTVTLNETGTNTLNSSFFGAGPVIGAQGAAPIWGPLEFDYRADGAVLIGEQRLVQTTTTAFSFSPSNIVLSGSPLLFPTTTGPNVLSNKTVAIFNGDIEAGLAYWVNPHLKLTASYRLDAFFGALRTIDASGNLVNVSRYYQGPRVGLDAAF
jgi:hypothetical protein